MTFLCGIVDAEFWIILGSQLPGLVGWRLEIIEAPSGSLEQTQCLAGSVVGKPGDWQAWQKVGSRGPCNPVLEYTKYSAGRSQRGR